MMSNSHIFLEAIARQRCVGAIYNRGEVLLAPHILYTRFGDLFLDATTVARDGRKPRETKLGTFKVAGLGGPRLTETGFDPDPSFDRGAVRYEEGALFAVETGC